MKPNTNKPKDPELKPRSDPNAKNNLILQPLTKAENKTSLLSDRPVPGKAILRKLWDRLPADDIYPLVTSSFPTCLTN